MPRSERGTLAVYDGSTVSDRALQAALDRAKETGGRVTVLVVIPPRLWRAKRGQFQISPDKHDEEFSRTLIDRAKRLCAASGVKAKGLLRSGPPLGVILEESRKGYEAVVIGDRGNLTGAPSLASLVTPSASCEVVRVL
jgi:nucleotide-binding universal stress UspA family protein